MPSFPRRSFAPLRSALMGLFAPFAFAFAAAGCGSFPSTAADVLNHSDQFEIYALDPYQEASGGLSFHGHPVIGHAKVADPAAQRRILDIIEEGMGKPATQAKCFNPRHAVHAARGGRTVDVTICYECSNIEISEGDSSTMTSTGNVRSALDVEFAAFGVRAAAP